MVVLLCRFYWHVILLLLERNLCSKDYEHEELFVWELKESESLESGEVI